jgi:hypothetical protein
MDWPLEIRTLVATSLVSRFPVVLWIGPDLTLIYNDGYIPILGEKHPAALGAPGSEVWWEIWDVVGPMLESVVRTGVPTWACVSRPVSPNRPRWMRSRGRAVVCSSQVSGFRRQPPGPLIFDLSAAAYFDSAGFEVLDRRLATGGLIAVVSPTSALRKAASLMSVPFHDTVEAASAAISGTRA